MHLYLIRHAHALDGDDDVVRPLSPKGRKQIRAVGKWLRDTGAFEAVEIWHSPLRRAEETAKFLARRLKSKARLTDVGGLRPDDAADSIYKKLHQLRHPVALVGHEPHLSALASLLVAGESVPARFVFKKCSVLRLDRIDGVWAVRWQISPELV
ncbi:Phosphohistidine phosphatase SixA [Lacunisphaera limnophila]|uniref:Phosphohistidine phosphatase SixA n=1 Tax=Lacunisphaera limnophila TaxID=1838286 RepID=A0A1I7PI18_9BACT|nr:phosphohistidine phosphatase SixA [Lacunisphaera limnophila]AOS43271.1 Phosphohistidine phosphatase SixA [Lacunisphaera limnophila]